MDIMESDKEMGQPFTKEQGYLTSAYGGEQFLDQALNLACSIKRFDPTRSISLITDARLASQAGYYKKLNYFENIFVFEANQLSGFKGKLLGSEVSPYKRTIYADSDCLLVQKVEWLWAHMESQDFCVQGESVYQGTYAGLDVKHWREQLGIPCLPVFNGGCFSWNESGKKVLRRAVQILEDARNYFLPSGTYGFDDDQPAIGIAMAEFNIKPLSNSLNLHYSFTNGSDLLLDLSKGFCKFKKGEYWAEPSVFHYNALVSADMYRSASRKVLRKEINDMRRHFGLKDFHWRFPGPKVIFSLIKNGLWPFKDNR